MNKVGRDEIIKVLQEVDRRIDFECELILIGGTAVIIGHGSDRGTKDTETWNKINEKVKQAWSEATEATGVNLQIDSAAAVAQAPEDFVSRVEEFDEIPLKYLRVKYPEKHDLALMKICRIADIDREDIQHLHAVHKLDADVLLERFKTELRPIYVGNQQDLESKYLYVVAILFGDNLAELHETALNR